MRVTDFVSASAIVYRLSALEAELVIEELAAALAKLHGLDSALVHKELLERERLCSTALGHGVAIPHGKLDIPRTLGVLGLSEQGIDFKAPDKFPARIFVALVSPKEGVSHLKALATVASELSDATLRQSLFEAKDSEEIHRLLAAPKSERPGRNGG